jgi:hypothetical protein
MIVHNIQYRQSCTDEDTNINTVRTGNVLLRQDLGPKNRTLLQTPVYGIIEIAHSKSIVKTCYGHNLNLLEEMIMHLNARPF